jgi:hypothetical protein
VLAASAFRELVAKLSSRACAVELPLRLRREPGRATLCYIDKPLPPPHLTARAKNDRFHAAAMRSLLGGAGDDPATGGVPAGGAGERRRGYTYQAFELGELTLLVRCKHDGLLGAPAQAGTPYATPAQQAEEGENAAGGTRCSLPIAKATMEYWRPHAWETLAPAEHARRWAHLAVRPGAALVVCNIDPLRQDSPSRPHGETPATPGGAPGGGGESAGSLCHVQQYHHTPHCAASGLRNAPPNFQCAQVLAALAALLRQLLSLEAGGYVLRSSAGQARFGVWAAERPADASLLSAFSSRVAELPKAPSYALHDAMTSAGATDARTITFAQLEWRGATGQIPNTFAPNPDGTAWAPPGAATEPPTRAAQPAAATGNGTHPGKGKGKGKGTDAAGKGGKGKGKPPGRGKGVGRGRGANR